LPTESEFTRILQWPGYRVYQYEIDEAGRQLSLWVRRKRGSRKLECSGCGRKFTEVYDARERAVRDLAWGEYQTTVHIEVYRVKCPDCGVKVEKVPLLPSKAPYSERFEDAVGESCQSAPARQVARRYGLAQSTVRAIDRRFLERWQARRRVPALEQMGVDEIYLGKKIQFVTVVSNLKTGEPLWFGRERKKETLDGYFREMSAWRRRRIEAACVDMWEPWKLSIEQWAPQCRIVYDKFHIMGHANKAVDEVRRAEFFRQGGWKRKLVKGKRWLLLARWVNLEADKKQLLNELFKVNRRMLKAYLLKESSGPSVELRLRGRDAAILAALAGPVALAAPGAVSETGPDATRPSGRHPQLLQDQGSDGRCGSCQWQHQSVDPSRAGLQGLALLAAEGTLHGRNQDRIRRYQESRLKCGFARIPAQSRFLLERTHAPPHRRRSHSRHIAGG
jgi:transposase